MFLLAFYKRDLEITFYDANEFRGKAWKKTTHNLDFIIEKTLLHRDAM
ncbi:MAG: hypothetical protein ACP5SB_01765 [Caldisericaceae bacterium]